MLHPESHRDGDGIQATQEHQEADRHQLVMCQASSLKVDRDQRGKQVILWLARA
jgi:hypothetical protein